MSTHFKYFPQDKSAEDWGLSICDVGWQQISPEEDYPLRDHPDGYYYTWETGRRLQEYQVCMVFQGRGIVEYSPDQPIELHSGTIFLLAPGQWHRCKPVRGTEWSTLWIGFNGKIAPSVVRGIFKTDGCTTRTVDKAREFKCAAMRLIAQTLKSGESKPFSTAGDFLSLLGRLAEGDFDSKPELNSIAIRKAKSLIAEHAAEVIDFRAVARSVNMSYDVFRHHFAADTGLSPLKFQLSEKMRIARNLIVNTNFPISEIARQTGFASPAYFTRFFKSKTKASPLEYRRVQATAKDGSIFLRDGKSNPGRPGVGPYRDNGAFRRNAPTEEGAKHWDNGRLARW